MMALGFLVAVVVGIVGHEWRLRRALQEARAAENDLRLAIDTIPAIVWTTAPDGAVTFMNRAWRDFTGLTLEDGAQGRWIETLHPDEAQWVQSIRDAAVAEGRAYEVDARMRRADGRGWSPLRPVWAARSRGR